MKFYIVFFFVRFSFGSGQHRYVYFWYVAYTSLFFSTLFFFIIEILFVISNACCLLSSKWKEMKKTLVVVVCSEFSFSNVPFGVCSFSHYVDTLFLACVSQFSDDSKLPTRCSNERNKRIVHHLRPVRTKWKKKYFPNIPNKQKDITWFQANRNQFFAHSIYSVIIFQKHLLKRIVCVMIMKSFSVVLKYIFNWKKVSEMPKNLNRAKNVRCVSNNFATLLARLDSKNK